MSKFTKGNWLWYGDVVDSADTVFDEDMNPIAIVCPKDERKSIGRLIAVAPEMYRLLVLFDASVLDTLVEDEEYKLDDYDITWLEERLTEVRELLARINGAEAK